jgi:hypothetical protein
VAEDKKYISSVKIDLDSSKEATVYQIKDAEARALLDKLFNSEIILDCGNAPQE